MFFKFLRHRYFKGAQARIWQKFENSKITHLFFSILYTFTSYCKVVPLFGLIFAGNEELRQPIKAKQNAEQLTAVLLELSLTILSWSKWLQQGDIVSYRFLISIIISSLQNQ